MAGLEVGTIMMWYCLNNSLNSVIILIHFVVIIFCFQYFKKRKIKKKKQSSTIDWYLLFSVTNLLIWPGYPIVHSMITMLLSTHSSTLTLRYKENRSIRTYFYSLLIWFPIYKTLQANDFVLFINTFTFRQKFIYLNKGSIVCVTINYHLKVERNWREHLHLNVDSRSEMKYLQP